MSDLHLEFIKPTQIDAFIKKIPPAEENEICVLAGDIGNPHNSGYNYDVFMKFVSKNFKKVFVIPGNHEYYNEMRTIDETNKILEEYFKQFDNISWLNNSYEHYNGYCFIGSIMWSNITDPRYQINDTSYIPNFDYVKYNQLNKVCVSFIENAIKTNDNCVVITHHMPSNRLTDLMYKTPKMLPYNQWFYCDMEQQIETNKYKIKCWIYGHTHIPSNKTLSDVPVVCNPIGYPNETAIIDFKKTINV
jgi:predicted phosphodiesterase